MAVFAPFPVDAFPCEPTVHIFAQPMEAEMHSPFPEENEFAQTLHRRGLHFIAGRLAAHAALAKAGAAPRPILRGPHGAPQWPEGFCGSISHTHGMAIAAICHCAHYAGLGIDIEKRERTVETSVQRLICHPNELTWINGPTSLPVQPTMALIAAKEVIFKAYFPVSQVRLGYQDAQLHPSDESLQAEITYAFSSGARFPCQLSIRWALVRDYWVMFAALPHLPAPRLGL